MPGHRRSRSHGSRSHGSRSNGSRGRRRRPFLVALIATVGGIVGLAVIVSVVAAIFVGNLANTFDRQTDTITRAFPGGDRPAAGDGTNILLIGSDARTRFDPDGDRASGGRSDTLMLVHLPKSGHQVYLMSIMRDSWVPIPGHGEAKINAAYSWGGVQLTVQTVEQLLDVRIDNVAEIDFEGFRDMTNALGGVDVRSTESFTARGHAITRGENHLDGAAALAFVRERYAFADADHTRVRNQQAFMRGVLQGVLSRSTLTSPTRVQDFVSATTKYLAVDSGLTVNRLVELGWSLRGVRAGDLHTFTIPTAGGGTSPDGQSYVSLNGIEVAELSRALRSDDVGAWLQQNR
jgi:LCP family protein required for cell wall assembly